MKNQNLPSFSTHKDGTQEFNFKAPSSWAELSEDQLRYVLSVMSIHHDHIVIKCYLLARFCGLTVHKYTRTGWKCSVKCDEREGKGVSETGKVRERVLYISAAEILSMLKNFDFIDRPFSPMRFKELLVSPNSMKSRIIRLFDNEIKNAHEGKPAWVKIKINHITDQDIVNKMYAASKAGVRIDALVRGNCSLVPGVEGVSENIRIVGIIDRYLEHSRILVFCNNDRPRYFIGSADWMPRNLVNRIEVMTPVYDEDMKRDLMRTLDYGLSDTVNGRIVDGLGTNEIQPVKDGEVPFRSQEQLHIAYSQQNDNK